MVYLLGLQPGLKVDWPPGTGGGADCLISSWSDVCFRTRARKGMFHWKTQARWGQYASLYSVEETLAM